MRRGGPWEQLGSDSWIRQGLQGTELQVPSIPGGRAGFAPSLPCPPHPTPFSTGSSTGQDPSEQEVRASLQVGGLRSGENSGLGLLRTRPVFCDNGSIGYSDTNIRQGMQAVSRRRWKRQVNGISPRASRRNTVLPTSFRLLISKIVK